MRKFIKQQAKSFLKSNPRFYQLFLDDLEEQGIRFLRHCEDHSMVFFPNDTVGKRMRTAGDFGRDTVRRVKAMLSQARPLPAEPAILELGANVGTHTVYLALEFPSARITAVEPDIQSAEILKYNININEIDSRAEVRTVAVSDQPGHMTFIRDHHNRGASSLVQNSKSIAWTEAQSLSDGYQEISVEVQTADAVVQTLPDGHVDFVWMDVEGHEMNVFMGFQETIAKARPPMYFEYNAPRQSDENRARLKRLIFDHYSEVYLDHEGAFTRITEQTFDTFSVRRDLLIL
ncbi:MAG: FkbM family methyltransferase [Pseudomonadota bacterium]